jgi:hypothetical protein
MFLLAWWCEFFALESRWLVELFSRCPIGLLSQFGQQKASKYSKSCLLGSFSGTAPAGMGTLKNQ